MKELIRKFEKESGLEIYGLGARREKWEYTMEKFAELIVKECADIAKHHVMNISTYADAEFVEKQIETHFGVQE